MNLSVILRSEAVKERRNFSFMGLDFSRSMPRIGILVFSD